MTRVLAIMPCRGRPQQTARNVQRLIATADYADWKLVCVGGEAEADTLRAVAEQSSGVYQLCLLDRPHVPYWEALAEATAWPALQGATLLVNLANDLLPGPQWLARAVAAFDSTFEGRAGMMGFNGDGHETGHSCHFLISRELLEYFGGWPVWYSHNYGDTEFCQRAIALRRYAKAPYALLYHDHPVTGGTDDDVYAAGRASAEADQALFERRRRRGWTH